MNNKGFDEVMSASDFALLKQGQRKGFDRAYSLYADEVYSLCYYLIGNEITSAKILQKTFDTALKFNCSFDTAKSFSHWLREYAITHCIEHLKKQAHKNHFEQHVLTNDHDLQRSDLKIPRMSGRSINNLTLPATLSSRLATRRNESSELFNQLLKNTRLFFTRHSNNV